MVINPKHRPSLQLPYHPGKITVLLISTRGRIEPRATVRSEGLSQQIESATIRLVEECINEMLHRVSHCIERLLVMSVNFGYSKL